MAVAGVPDTALQSIQWLTPGRHDPMLHPNAFLREKPHHGIWIGLFTPSPVQVCPGFQPCVGARGVPMRSTTPRFNLGSSEARLVPAPLSGSRHGFLKTPLRLPRYCYTPHGFMLQSHMSPLTVDHFSYGTPVTHKILTDCRRTGFQRIPFLYLLLLLPGYFSTLLPSRCSLISYRSDRNILCAYPMVWRGFGIGVPLDLCYFFWETRMTAVGRPSVRSGILCSSKFLSGPSMPRNQPWFWIT